MYKELRLLGRTTVIVTSLTGGARPAGKEDLTKPAIDGAATLRLPWIAWGAGIKPGHAIQQLVSIIDTGATVLRTLNLETHTEWDSRPVEEIFTAPRTAAVPAGNRAY
jgi:arylsulfatase A-like enzyme